MATPVSTSSESIRALYGTGDVGIEPIADDQRTLRTDLVAAPLEQRRRGLADDRVRLPVERRGQRGDERAVARQLTAGRRQRAVGVRGDPRRAAPVPPRRPRRDGSSRPPARSPARPPSDGSSADVTGVSPTSTISASSAGPPTTSTGSPGASRSASNRRRRLRGRHHLVRLGGDADSHQQVGDIASSPGGVVRRVRDRLEPPLISALSASTAPSIGSWPRTTTPSRSKMNRSYASTRLSTSLTRRCPSPARARRRPA